MAGIGGRGKGRNRHSRSGAGGGSAGGSGISFVSGGFKDEEKDSPKEIVSYE